MTVPMVQVRIMGVPVPHRLMAAPVGVGLGHLTLVDVPMMLVVHVGMIVLQHIVGVLMVVALGQVHPEAESHKGTGSDELILDGLSRRPQPLRVGNVLFSFPSSYVGSMADEDDIREMIGRLSAAQRQGFHVTPTHIRLVVNALRFDLAARTSLAKPADAQAETASRAKSRRGMTAPSRRSATADGRGWSPATSTVKVRTAGNRRGSRSTTSVYWTKSPSSTSCDCEASSAGNAGVGG